jgi:hypothetical protein
MIVITKKSIGSLQITNNGIEISCDKLHFEFGVNDHQIEYLEINNQRVVQPDIELYLDYKNMQIMGTTRNNSIRVEHNNTTLGLVQWLSFDYSIDKKPTLQLILNLWDEEDYDKAAH